MKPYQFGWNLTHDAAHWREIENFQRLSLVEMQYSLDDCATDRGGNAYTPTGQTPGDYLRSHGVDVIHYVCPFYSHDAAVYGSWPHSSSVPATDTYWLNVAIAQAADHNDWWLRCERTGQRPTGMGWVGETIYPLDIANPDFRDWFVKTVTANKGARHTLRFDCGWLGSSYESYLKCHICDKHPCRHSRTVQELTAGQIALYDALRAKGWKVVVNGGWEMADASEPPHKWQYPLIDHIDGVMIEANESVYVYHSRKDRWVWVREDAKIRRAIAKTWLAAGKVVIYAGHIEPTGFDDAYKAAIQEAQQYGYRVGLSRYRPQSQFEDWQESEKPAPLFDDIPVPPPEDWQAKLQAEAWQHHVIDINPDAALYRAMLADGYHPASDEWSTTIDGVLSIAQYADSDSNQRSPRAYFVPVGDWEKISWIKIQPKPDKETGK